MYIKEMALSLRAVFKVKTLAVLFPPYPREMKKNVSRNLNLLPFWRWLVSMEIVQPIPMRASMRTHLTAVGPNFSSHFVSQRSLQNRA